MKTINVTIKIAQTATCENTNRMSLKGVVNMDKKETLLGNGSFNKNYSKVKKAKFLEDSFYDPMDIIQIKYELIQDAKDARGGIEKITSDYGYTRASYYLIKAAFEKGGLAALAPGKTGPKTPYKLTLERQEHIERYISENPSANSAEVVADLLGSKGIKISKRTVERYRRKKKPH